MAFKIGFAANDEPIIEKPSVEIPTAPVVPRKSVVQVAFPESGHLLAYYNDQFDLHKGDRVYVDGKLEGQLGRVVEVSYNFKIKVSDYQRVTHLVDTSIRGRFQFAGDHLITFDSHALPYAKAVSWFKAPGKEDVEIVCGNDDSAFPLEDLSKMKISPVIMDRGLDYYISGHVKYLCLDGNRGHAIVVGTKPYEVDFEYHNGEIRNLTCDCFCPYSCKHEVAAMLQLRETLKFVEKYYSDEYQPSGYFATIGQDTLYDRAFSGRMDILAKQQFSIDFNMGF